MRFVYLHAFHNQNDARWAIDDGEASDGSSDSDAILNGQVPDPVGLPR